MTHGVFDTYFIQNTFNFTGAPTTASVDTQSNPGYDPTATSGTDLSYLQFDVDVSGLAAGYGLHFDLYNLSICTTDKGQCQVAGDADQSQFAPFSHDAEYVPPGGTPSPGPVPEPATLALFGLGAIAMGVTRRRKRR